MPSPGLRMTVLSPIERGRLLEKPFEMDPRFEHRWWNGLVSTTAGRAFVSFHDDLGAELARAQVQRRRFAIGDQYPTVPAGTERYSQVEFFEVASDQRLRGIGKKAVALLSGWSPSQLLAFSEADDFWRSVGWVEHTASERGYQTLFLE